MARVLDCFLHWHPRPDTEAEFAGADVIITHGFDDQKELSRTTVAITALGVELAKRFAKPLICQFPANEVAEREGVKPSLVITAHLLKPGEYLDTEEVNRQVFRHCWRKGWRKVILCTHPHHAWRARENLKRHGLTPFLPDLSGIAYDPALWSSRKSLSTPLIFVPREILARLLYLHKGYI